MGKSWQLPLHPSRAPAAYYTHCGSYGWPLAQHQRFPSRPCTHRAGTHATCQTSFPEVKNKTNTHKPQPWPFRYSGSLSGSQENGNAMEQVSDAREGATGGAEQKHRGVMQSGVQFSTTRPQYQTLMPSSRGAVSKAPAPGRSLAAEHVPAGCSSPNWLLILGKTNPLQQN